jgi:hypothetical protein
MTKDWLHFPSLGRTIDFNVVSDICWNEQSIYDKRFRTLVYLGTSIGIGEEYGIERPHLSILEKEDRKKLYSKFLGIPIELLFDEPLLPSEALFNKDATGEEVSDTDPIPF